MIKHAEHRSPRRARVVAIVQARMGSTRLPGKVLADLGGRTMLARVVRRAGRAARIDEVVVATSVASGDDPIVGECERLGVACVRGSEQDVLARYHQAAETCRADVLVRITADCPLIDPGVSDRVIAAFLEERPDYASNILRRTYPRGLDTEVMPRVTLTRAFGEASELYQRTHVTPYIYQHPERFRLLAVTGSTDRSGHRWTVDSPEDLELIRAIYQRMGGDDFGWEDVLHLLADAPRLSDLNRHVRHKALVEG